MAYHLYPIRLADPETRDRLRDQLKARGIESGVHYPIPNHLQPAMAGKGTPPSLPESEALARTTLSLPMFPGLADGDVDAVIAAVQEFHPALVKRP